MVTNLRPVITALAALSAVAAVTTLPARAQDAIWWEAEKPRATNFPPAAQNPFGPANPQEAAILSEGQWIGTGSDRPQTLFLEYDIDVAKAGTYQLYARKFWQHGPFRWRVDDGPWRDVPRKTALLDEAPIRLHTVANWVHAGEAALQPGRHTLRVELTENTGAAAFDAFLLTTAAFTPRGKLKPGEKFGRAPEGWFPFEPDPDTFRDSPIDLRRLNEKAAGDNGFIGVRGEEFVHKNSGKTVRFWAVNTGAHTVNMDRGSIDLMARSLAKQGVNLIRIHGGVWGSDFRKADPEHLDRLFYFISAMKREGIYTCLSIYFPLWLDLKPEHGFEGYNGKHPFALLFFNPEFQSIYRGWWKSLLATENPYTKRTLANDPAVAMVELVNEDSYLFWTFKPYDEIPGPQMALLERQFGNWLTKKYGSVEKALTAWGGGRERGDDPAAGRAGFMNLWAMFNQKGKRAEDTAQFLTESQKTFYEQTMAYLRGDLGYQATIYASNWITADARVLGPLDKYSNTVADFMDRHGYFGGPHEGERAGYSLSKGDRYDDRSALLFSPDKAGGQPNYGLPIMDICYNGKPSTITEVNWTPPNRYRADFPLVAAAYGALQGTDGVFYFATGAPAWEQILGKFSLRTPVIAGQFPAMAVMYRQGLVKPAATVVDVALPVKSLYALQGAPVTAPLNLDELRAKDIPAGQTAPVDRVSSIDPLAPLVGKVDLNFVAEGGTSRIADLSKYIDRNAKRVRSQTGELLWDWGVGKVTVDSPSAQAVTGFLQRMGSVDLGAVTIQSPMHYGTIALVALDEKPIAQSARMLLQVMSEDTNYGWEAPGEGVREIKNLGTAPIVVKEFQGMVSLKRPDAASLKVTPLDFNGYPAPGIAGQRLSAASLSLQPRTLYYLIEK